MQGMTKSFLVRAFVTGFLLKESHKLVQLYTHVFNGTWMFTGEIISIVHSCCYVLRPVNIVYASAVMCVWFYFSSSYHYFYSLSSPLLVACW